LSTNAKPLAWNSSRCSDRASSIAVVFMSQGRSSAASYAHSLAAVHSVSPD
jgi:hypothetical protein